MGQPAACSRVVARKPSVVALQMTGVRDRTHDLRIKGTELTEDYWGPSDSKQDRKRPSSLLKIPIVPVETNGLSTVCLQSGASSLLVDFARKPALEVDVVLRSVPHGAVGSRSFEWGGESRG